MYRVGIIGCGGISTSHHDGFQKTGKATVTTVFDVNADAANEKAQAWGARAASSAEELVGDADIVVIATPGFAHREYVEVAAARGKHILCEKPIALSLEDAEAIRAAVASSPAKFQVNFLQRYHGRLAQIKRMQDEGKIGGTVSAWAQQHSPSSSERWRRIEQSGHWRASMELSGGRINEFCGHTVNWLLWVLGRPKTVYGKALYVTEGFNLDDADYMVLECERGVGIMDVQRNAAVAPLENYGIIGHAGSVALSRGKITLTAIDGKPVEVEPRDTGPGRHESFLRCIEEDRVPLTGIEDAIDTLRVCLAFNRSAASGKVEQV